MIATPERPLLTEDFPSSPDQAQNSHIYHEIPEHHQPIHRPIQAQLFQQQSQQLHGGSTFNNPTQNPHGGSSC